MISNYKFGIFAEWLVMLRYQISLHKIIAHRMRNKGGEIDIICTKRNLLIFIEVKARSRSDFDDILCHQQQINRIKNAARLYIYQNHQRYKNFDVRFDLALVKPFQLPQIIQNAW